MTTAPRELWNQDAEHAVLSAMLNDEQAIVTARALLTASSFYRTAHADIFAAILATTETGRVVDPITVAEALGSALPTVGGSDYLGFLWDAIPTAANITYHAGIVRDWATRRELLQLLQSAALQITTEASDAATIAKAASQALLPFTLDDGEAPGYLPISKTLWSTMEAIEARATGTTGGILTGYARIDRETGGFRAGELLIIGGAEKQGKSAVALNLCLRIASRTREDGGGACAYVSAEMTRQTLEERCLAWASHVDSHKLATGRLTDDDFPRLARAGGDLARFPLWIDDEAEPSLADVVSRTTALKSAHPELRVVVVDFLQLVHDRQKGVSEAVELKRVAYGLKRMAKQLKLLVIAPCQVNSKDVEELKDPRPRLKDLQGSSGMRQAADFVALLFRPGAYDSLTASAQEVELNFAACRRTPSFLARLHWHGATLRVDDHAVAPRLP